MMIYKARIILLICWFIALEIPRPVREELSNGAGLKLPNCRGNSNTPGQFLTGFILLPSGSQEPKVLIGPRAKKSEKETPRTPNIRVDTTLVAVDVTVIDPLNRLVAGLEKKNFRLFEDGVEQVIQSLLIEDTPIAVGLVFDVSGSMGEKLKKAREAVIEFFKTTNPEDEFFLVQFSDRAELAVDFTRDSGEIQNKLIFARSKGKTALLDAIYLAISNMKKANNSRKALVVISDGGDNNSRYIEGEIKNLVRESDVQIYAIGIYEPIDRRARSSEELSGPQLLTDIAERTGGRHFAVQSFPIQNLNELSDIAIKIGMELHNQYVLYFSPKNKAKDGKYRRLRVKLVAPPTLPDLRVYARMGYYAPSQ